MPTPRHSNPRGSQGMRTTAHGKLHVPPCQAKGIRMVSKEEPEEGTLNAEADILGPAQSKDDCESVL